MNDNFDKKLREMAKKSNVIEPEELRKNIDITCKNLKNKYFDYKTYLAAASIFIAVVVTIGIYKPTYAEELTLVKKVISYFTGKYNSVNQGYKENSQSEDITLKSKGYSISIEDIYYDRVEMTIFYKIKSDKPLNISNKYLLNAKFKGEVDIEVQWGNEEGEFIDDFTYAGFCQLYMMEKNSGELPEVFNGILEINGLIVSLENKYEEIPLKLNSIPLVLDSKRNKGEEIEINKIVALDGDSTEYIKAKKLPTGITLDVIRGTDIFRDYIIEENLWDSKKGALSFKSRVYDDSSGRVILSRRFENPSEDGEILIVPYIYSAGPYGDGGDRIRNHKFEEKSKLDLGQYGTMEIEKIEFRENETVMTIKTKGYISFEPFSNTTLCDNEKNFYQPISITNIEVYGFMEMKADYIFKPMNSEIEYMLSYYEEIRMEVLEDEIIKIRQ